jgi:predicted DNA-binding transcriptional regulator AlpA
MEPTKSPIYLNYKDLLAFGIRFSREHLLRLEAASKFPKRIYLSSQKVVWLSDEVVAWRLEREAERDTRVYRVHE